MTRGRRDALLGYGLALGLPAVTEALRVFLSARSVAPHWLILFLPGVMASAWWGGVGPGLVCSGVSALIVMYFELPPRHSLRVEDVAELVGVAVLVGIGLVLSLLVRGGRS